MEGDGGQGGAGEEGQRKGKKRKAEKKERDPNLPHCKYFLSTKGRCCRLQPLRGKPFCGEHIALNEDLEGRERIVCPLDPNHTCFKHLLEKHIKTCNSRAPDQYPDYYKANVNGVHANIPQDDDCPQAKEEEVAVDFDSMNSEQLNSFVDLLLSSRNRFPEVEESGQIHPVVACRMVQTDVGAKTAKHLAQVGSLLNLMEKEGLFKDGTCFIEFGSGRGGLSYYIGNVLLEKRLTDCSLILIDNTSPRHKHDNKLSDTSVEVQRIRIDIKDVVVDRLPAVESDKTKHVVAVAKHLCGAALDMTLYALLENNKHRAKNAGGVFASCCHHRCEMKLFPARNFLKTILPERVPLLVRLASWYVDGVPRDVQGIGSQKFNTEVMTAIRAATKLDETTKEMLGRTAKEILDWCRCSYISKHNLETCKSKLVHYTDKSTTLENVAIIFSHYLQTTA